MVDPTNIVTTNSKSLMRSVAYTVSHQKPKVVRLLQEHGHRFSPAADYREIVRALTQSMQDPEFVTRFSQLVVRSKNLAPVKATHNRYLNAEGDDSANAAGSVIAGAVGAVAGAIGSIFDSKTQSAQAQAQNEQNLMQLIMQAEQNKSKGGSNTTAWIVGGLAVGALVIGGIIISKSQSNG